MQIRSGLVHQHTNKYKHWTQRYNKKVRGDLDTWFKRIWNYSPNLLCTIKWMNILHDQMCKHCKHQPNVRWSSSVPCKASKWKPSLGNSEVSKVVLIGCSRYFLLLHQFLLVPSHRADMQLAMDLSWRGFGDFPYLWSGDCRLDSWKDQLEKNLILGYLFLVSQLIFEM